jgi:hypothetical protein
MKFDSMTIMKNRIFKVSFKLMDDLGIIVINIHDFVLETKENEDSTDRRALTNMSGQRCQSINGNEYI